MILPNGVPKPHVNSDGSCSYVWMDLYTPYGKWKYGGVVYVGEVKPWQDGLLQALKDNQKIVIDGTLDSKYWTIVVDDLVSLAKLPEYKFLWKRIVQVGIDSE